MWLNFSQRAKERAFTQVELAWRDTNRDTGNATTFYESVSTPKANCTPFAQEEFPVSCRCDARCRSPPRMFRGAFPPGYFRSSPEFAHPHHGTDCPDLVVLP